MNQSGANLTARRRGPCATTSRAPVAVPPAGISLLEVMLATVLLLAAVMALSRVAFLARRHAISAEDRSQAQLLCQNILQEVLAGARPLQNVSPEAFEGDNWVYMINVEGVEGMTEARPRTRPLQDHVALQDHRARRSAGG